MTGSALNLDLAYDVLAFAMLAIIAGGICAALIMLLRPLLLRHVMAKPNRRSSHKEPTPQGGGIAVIAAVVVAVACAFVIVPDIETTAGTLGILMAATVGLALVGVSDDVRPLGATPRLVLQGIAVAVVIAILPENLRVLPFAPWWAERALMLIAGVWLVNLTNFMDGIDLMTVGEVVPVTTGLMVAAALGALPDEGTLVAVALCGALLGFAPFNKPVARIFLGDVGSLPIGLLMFWLLLLLAGAGHLAAAMLLPLYYVADATVTLIRRFRAGEQITQAHRSHFYQRALDRGLSVRMIIARVVFMNVALIVLATTTILYPSHWIDALALAAGCLLVGWRLYRFERSS
jgi:UDP-N-acetylmuramyl pentapeptide phosphotransferase/UDP-N-acetylglucosamine-1-phosphate transferase